ncbi:MAG: sigma 54-interacting transcriptional regulator, partial [Myxococcales bacterium]|nr:sigma 54-interacting transcriptional regulator [Myxococcales bacterium]
SGVGKELVAQAIHLQSARRAGPFITVNCSALPRDLLESELFGHERGAFTGAVHRHTGRFEQARGGTLFLDELGDLPPSVQITLLRVLQEREFRRVGGTETVRVDARVIAATHRDLESLIESGDFRADLYYRLNVFPIRVPPLRERRDDITLLVDYFIEHYARLNARSVQRISTPAIDMLMAYHWPGNVRELANCIERAVLITDDEVIHGNHLPPTLQTAEATGTIGENTLDNTLDTMERELLIEALKNARGNRAKAARALGISERVMGLRVKKHGIDARRFKARRRPRGSDA